MSEMAGAILIVLLLAAAGANWALWVRYSARRAISDEPAPPPAWTAPVPPVAIHSWQPEHRIEPDPDDSGTLRPSAWPGSRPRVETYTVARDSRGRFVRVRS